MSPDARELRVFLTRVARRLTWISAAEGAAAGLGVAILLTLGGWPGRAERQGAIVAGIALAAVGIAARILLVRRGRPSVAQLVERSAPQCRNVVITADELSMQHASTGGYIAALVWRDAARVVRRLDPARLFPGRRALALFAASAALWIAALMGMAAPVSASISRIAGSSGTATIDAVDVTIVPPAYTGRSSRIVHDPNRIDALAGSRLHLSVRSSAAALRVESLNDTQTLGAPMNGMFTAELPADADDYLALQPSLSNGRPGVRTLIGLSVTADSAPRVRITAPARDLTLRGVHDTIGITVIASDDIGLASLRLRYTRVSGSGERFTFVEGSVPLDVVRRDARSWTAHARWALDSLSLAPGDMVVYRAVVTDHRPGAVPSESDSFIAEVAAPGSEAAAGFALDPHEERYAVSQQMVILKTEQLLARRPAMSDSAYREEAQNIAAEQRKVRAEFVFMMGGEVAGAPASSGSMTELNEESEARGETDLAAGRVLNQGRAALQGAVRSMSRASALLATASVPAALPEERAALEQLERAFSRTRILLRALTEHERLDLSRRLSGTLAGVMRDIHPRVDPTADPRMAALRRVLAGVASLADTAARGDSASVRASSLAMRLLQVDPSDGQLQIAAAVLDSAATSLAHGRRSNALSELDRAAAALAAALRRGLSNAPPQAPSITGSRLEGALADALRGLRGPR